jgi:DNA-binding NarL/FixJ family response regulator
MKIMICDDHALLREGLAQLLTGIYPRLTLLHAATGAQALDLLLPHRDIDLVLLDYQLPDMTGLDLLAELAKIQPRLKVLMVSGSLNPYLLQQALGAGASGFVSKTGDVQDLMRAIDLALKGEIAPKRIVDSAGPVGLSPRQEAVLHRLMEGHSNRDIALALDVSEETIKTHVSAILRHFKAENRTQAALIAMAYGVRSPLSNPPALATAPGA